MDAYANQHRTEYEVVNGTCVRVWDCIWYAGTGIGSIFRVSIIAEDAEAEKMYKEEIRSYEEN